MTCPPRRALRLYLRERPSDFKGFLSFLVDHGFTGVIGEYTNGPWMRHHEDIRKAGLELGVSPGFAHPAPFVDEDRDQVHEEGKGERALRLAVAELAELGAAELHPDFEGGYAKLLQRTRRKQAAAAVFALRPTLPQRIVITSYPTFPVQIFARPDVDASVQVYDRRDDQPLTFASTWIKRWRAYGFRSVRAGVGTYKLIKGPDGKDVAVPKPLARQRAYLESFPAGVDGDVWTSLRQQTDFRTHEATYAELRRFARGE